MNQFVTTQNNIGDMTVEAGVVIDVTAATTGVFPIAPGTADGVPVDPGISVTRAAPRFAGGSSRNMVITQLPTTVIPGGWMIQTGMNQWTAEDGPFSIDVAPNGTLRWSDGDDYVMTAPAGSIPIDNRFACASPVINGGIGGGEFIVDLGTATGLVTLDFEAYTVPDIFKIEYNGVEVVNTGYRGTSGTYDGVPVTVAGAGTGSASFTKSTATPTFCKVIVVAPFTGTAWEFTCGCPAAGSPPYITTFGRNTFTASSTAYGQASNGGTAFSRSVTFEGAESLTTIEMLSDLVPDISSEYGLPMAFQQRLVSRWTYYGLYSIEIAEDGSSSLIEVGGIIATRASSNFLDPSGSYEATTYGKNKYNNGNEFFVSVTMQITAPIELYTYLELSVSSGSLTGVKGPYSAPALPANTPGEKFIPISYSDGAGRVTQYYEGALFWK